MINQDNFDKVLTFYNQLKNQWIDVESARIDLYQNVSGKQMWATEDRLKLESQRRPVLQYNLMLPILLYLEGSQRQARSYMRVIPNGEEGEEQTSRLMTKLMYWNFNKTRYEEAHSKAFMHSIIGSIGWKHDWYDYQEGHWVCKAFDSMRIRFDTRTQSSVLDDCRYLQDTQWSTKEDIFSLIDDAETLDLVKKDFYFLEPAGRSTSFLDKQFTNWTWAYTPKQQEWDYIDTVEGRYRLIDHHEMRDVTEQALVDVTDSDKFVMISDKRPEEIQALIQQNNNFVRYEFTRKEFWHTIICPAIRRVIVDERYPIQTGQFAFKPLVCYDIIPQLKETTSVFTNLKDINDSVNKRKSTMLEYIMMTVGGRWIAREDSLANPEDWENNEAGVILKWKKNTVQPVKEEPVVMNQGLVEYEREDRDFMQVVSGVTPNLRGMRESANETGVLARQKIQQAEIVFAKLFANTELSQVMDARSCIKNIQQGMTLPRKIRVLNPTGDPEWLYLNWETVSGKINDLSYGEYDIEIDSTKPSITSQQLAFYELSDLMKTMPPEMTILLLDKYIMASDIPDKMVIVKRLKAVMKQQFGFDPDNPEQIYSNPAMQQGQPQNPAMGGQNQLQNQAQNPLMAQLMRSGIA